MKKITEEQLQSFLKLVKKCGLQGSTFDILLKDKAFTRMIHDTALRELVDMKACGCSSVNEIWDMIRIHCGDRVDKRIKDGLFSIETHIKSTIYLKVFHYNRPMTHRMIYKKIQYYGKNIFGNINDLVVLMHVINPADVTESMNIVALSSGGFGSAGEPDPHPVLRMKKGKKDVRLEVVGIKYKEFWSKKYSFLARC